MSIVNSYGIPFQPTIINNIVYFRETETVAIITEISKRAKDYIAEKTTNMYLGGFLSGAFFGTVCTLGLMATWYITQPSKKSSRS
jgi:hypothetical protein